MGGVSCEICGAQFRSLYGHLKVHNLMGWQYRARFPGAPTSCQEVRIRQVQGGREGKAISRSKPWVRITRPMPGSEPRVTQQDAGTAPVVSGVNPAVQGGHALKVAG